MNDVFFRWIEFFSYRLILYLWIQIRSSEYGSRPIIVYMGSPLAHTQSKQGKVKRGIKTNRSRLYIHFRVTQCDVFYFQERNYAINCYSIHLLIITTESKNVALYWSKIPRNNWILDNTWRVFKKNSMEIKNAGIE
jgi:hypothetical protein